MSWLPWLRHSNRGQSRHRLLQREELLERLEKERLRTNRTGFRFCLIKLELREAVKVPHQLAVLSKLLQKRLRKTDEKGLLQPTELGIFLPDTPVEGAWKLYDDIIEILPLTVEPPVGTVYTYPVEQFSDASTTEELGSTAEQGRIAKPLELLL